MAETQHKPSLIDVVLAAIRFELAKVHTSIPGVIVEYDRASQRATVQPAIAGAYVDPDTRDLVREPLPPIPDVPVAFPSGDGYSVTFDLAVGDRVLLVFSERSTEEFRATGDEGVEPGDLRRFDLSDAVAFPAALQFSEPVPAEGVATGALVVRGVEVKLGDANAVDFVTLDTLVVAQLTAVKTALDAAAAAATVAALPNDGGFAAFTAFRASLTASLASWPASMAASKVKAI